MKQIFVLDENVLIQSHTCRNISNSEDDFNSLNLIINILEECHKIGLSSKLVEKYCEKITDIEKCRKPANALKIWRNFLNRKDKQVMCDSHQKKIPLNIQHDAHVIEPALFLSAILVTTDKKLKARVLQWSEIEHHRISVKSPKEAMDFIFEIKTQA
jgi:hypothetical protein